MQENTSSDGTAMASRSEQFALAVAGLLGAALLDDEKCQRAAYRRLHEIDGSEAGSFSLAGAMAAVAGAGLSSGDIISCCRDDDAGPGSDVQVVLSVVGALIAAVANGDYAGAQQAWGSLDVYEEAQAYAIVFAIAVIALKTAMADRADPGWSSR